MQIEFSNRVMSKDLHDRKFLQCMHVSHDVFILFYCRLTLLPVGIAQPDKVVIDDTICFVSLLRQ